MMFKIYLRLHYKLPVEYTTLIWPLKAVTIIIFYYFIREKNIIISGRIGLVFLLVL